MKKTEAQKKIEEIELEMVVGARRTDLNRSRSISVGTSFGGTTEISMRGDGGRYLWCTMQPVEVTELIHQLSANIGCHVALKPRDDFGSWREWRISEAEKKHLNGWPPFVNDMAPFNNLGALGFNQQQAEQMMKDWLKIKEYEYTTDQKNQEQLPLSNSKKELKNEDAVAAKKAINRRKSNRTSGTS